MAPAEARRPGDVFAPDDDILGEAPENENTDPRLSAARRRGSGEGVGQRGQPIARCAQRGATRRRPRPSLALAGGLRLRSARGFRHGSRRGSAISC